MGKYTICKNDKEIHVFGDDQSFSKEDIENLWKTHHILYLSGGVMAIWVEERLGMNPLVHLMQEDDGHIFWEKEKDICFDIFWTNNYIETLSELNSRFVKKKGE